MSKREHWDAVYSRKAPNSLSWFQEHVTSSLNLIESLNLDKHKPIIDIGAGVSTLVDDLILNGYSDLTVLDISVTALEIAKKRNGLNSDKVQWQETDVTKVKLSKHQFEVWHDRAVFHFLTKLDERKAYIRNMLYSVRPFGHIIIATFADDGPTECSNLPVMRYSANSLQAELGENFLLKLHFIENHRTPFGTTQKFAFCHFIKII